MNDPNLYSIQEQIEDTSAKRPHVVILGAGASLQALPEGDKYGKVLPLINNFVEVLELQNLLEAYGVDFHGKNFEELYSSISSDPAREELTKILEYEIRSYFFKLELPNTPTIYDYLVLSLRPKDVIATFNWDPFLVQAFQRNAHFANMPQLVYLHGNAKIVYCPNDKIKMIWTLECPKCGEETTPSQMLYPVLKKNYWDKPFISEEWKFLQSALINAFLLTIFGYSAPTSDVEAVELMKNAWGKPEERVFEEIEIIDIKDDNILRENWREFIHTHHYSTKSDFFKSMLITHPRRSVEAYYQSLLMARHRQRNIPPITKSWDELYAWYSALVEHEQQS